MYANENRSHRLQKKREGTTNVRIAQQMTIFCWQIPVEPKWLAADDINFIREFLLTIQKTRRHYNGAPSRRNIPKNALKIITNHELIRGFPAAPTVTFPNLGSFVMAQFCESVPERSRTITPGKLALTHGRQDSTNFKFIIKMLLETYNKSFYDRRGKGRASRTSISYILIHFKNFMNNDVACVKNAHIFGSKKFTGTVNLFCSLDVLYSQKMPPQVLTRIRSYFWH